MPRSRSGNSERYRTELVKLLEEYEEHLKNDSLREKVCALVPCLHLLRNLGSSLIPSSLANTGRDRVLSYFRKYPLTVISGDELTVVSGIDNWARRLRELRVQFGWRIINGLTAKEMMEEGELTLTEVAVGSLNKHRYILISEHQDRDLAHRWNVANGIRRTSSSMLEKILRYLKENVGRPVTGEELRYVAGDKTSWARRTRQLRTEYGWSVHTRNTGRTDLPVGMYTLESLRQQEPHDRNISDAVRVTVLDRDNHKCTNCRWHFGKKTPSDPRTSLELHHLQHHADRGDNSPENLITICNVCHDEVHRKTSSK
jgi:hypothetical protein